MRLGETGIGAGPTFQGEELPEDIVYDRVEILVNARGLSDLIEALVALRGTDRSSTSLPLARRDGLPLSLRLIHEPGLREDGR